MGKRLHGLEAVRGIAALLVAYLHVAILAGFPTPASGAFELAYLAVDLFFLLSGFVLARTYEGRMPGVIAFTCKRYMRLWPPIACGVALGAIYVAGWGLDATTFTMNLLAGLAILPLVGFTFMFNPPAWSIFFELFANAMHALRLHKIPIAGLLAISIGSAGALLYWMGGDGLNVGDGDDFALGFARVMMSYCLGIVIYRVNKDRTWIPAHFAWPAVLSYALLIALYPEALHGHFEILFVLLVHPLILLSCLSMKPSKLAVLLGGFSFPLYAIHFPAQSLAIAVGMDWVSALVVSLIICGALGAVIDPRWRAQLAGLMGKRSEEPIKQAS